MKIALMRSGIDARHVPVVAKHADELGFESFWTSDHLVMPANIPPIYPHSLNGEPPFSSSSPWVDATVVLASVASVTKRLRIGTSVYILPLRSPFVAARAASALDIISQGRLIFGVGTGWTRGEFEAAGEDFDNRGKRTEEIVEILKKLWTEETIEFDGEFYSFDPVKFEPKPLQQPHPPVHFGGEAPVALRRAACLGDGWIGLPKSIEETRASIRYMLEQRAEVGKAKDDFEITVYCGLPQTLDSVRRYEELGVHRVGLLVGSETGDGGPDTVMLQLENWANDIVIKV